MAEKTVPSNKQEAIEFHREELERLTGKMISFRNREKFNETLRTLQKNKRVRFKEMEAELAKLKKKKAS